MVPREPSLASGRVVGMSEVLDLDKGLQRPMG
jgi:hypothetical protein